MLRALAIVVVAIIAACASATTGNGNGQQDASSQRLDGNERVFDDAPPAHLDAPRALDAFVPQDAPPDAPAGSGGQFCSVNMDCPDAGTCCFVAVCVPGSGIGSDLCFPS
jgi:hypothetical protein